MGEPIAEGRGPRWTSSSVSSSAPGLFDWSVWANRWGFGRGRGETGGNSRKLGRLIRGGQPERSRERQSGVVDIDSGLRRECISNVGEDVGCDEYITQGDGKFRQIKAASGRKSNLAKFYTILQ